MIAPLPLPPIAPIAPIAPVAPAAPVLARQSLIARPHTVLGVCEGIGEDLGFNPVYFRVAFAAGIFFAPMLVVGIYLALGVVVAASRFAFPMQVATPAAAASVKQPTVEVEDENYRIAA